MNRIIALALSAWMLHAAATGQTTKWVSAYYAGWWQGSQLSAGEIDYSAVTEILHFALVVKPDGTFAGEGNGITTGSSIEAVHAAHAAGKKILITAGGASSDAAFAGATSSGNRAAFVSALVAFMTRYSYDGIDIDWEPLESTQNYREFIRELRWAMTNAAPGSLLTTAVMMGTDGRLLADMARYFDQMNLMTYDMSGPWPQWVTWHNTALYDGGARFPSTGEPLPSADRAVRTILSSGVPAAKIGIGIDFYGYRWWGGEGTSTGGVSRPRQSWKSPPNVKDNIPYFQLMASYARYHAQWDSSAQAAYIGIDLPGSANDEFISFDNEQTIRSKAAYVNRMGLGGVIVFELGAGYRRSLPVPYRDLLLQSVRAAFLNGPPPPKDAVPPTVAFTSPRKGSVVSGDVVVSTAAGDNSAIAGIELRVDGEPLSPDLHPSPFSDTLNSWRLANGPHTLEAIAYDAFGNTGSARVAIRVRNEGSMPEIPDRIVYDDVLRPPFSNTSWGAVVNLDDHALAKSGSSSVGVDYMAWGAFDILCGTWGATANIDPAEFDTLKADIFPLTGITLKVAFYNNTSVDVTLLANQWNSVAIPLKFSQPFSRFYFQSNLGRPAKCYFDNIRFSARRYSTASIQ